MFEDVDFECDNDDDNDEDEFVDLSGEGIDEEDDDVPGLPVTDMAEGEFFSFN